MCATLTGECMPAPRQRPLSLGQGACTRVLTGFHLGLAAAVERDRVMFACASVRVEWCPGQLS